jgi:ribosomal protein L37E
MWVRRLGEWIQGDYWICTHCGALRFHEEEVGCWKCGLGEMIYRGKVRKIGGVGSRGAIRRADRVEVEQKRGRLSQEEFNREYLCDWKDVYPG